MTPVITRLFRAITGRRSRLTPVSTPNWWRLACVLPLVVSSVTAANAGSASKEYEIKAAFLYNFVKFVQWPSQSFASPESPIIIGVFGQNPFDGELERDVQGKKINGRRIEIRWVQNADDARQTQLLFVDASSDSKLDELMGAIKDVRVVTVGESDAFAHHGGTITFTTQGDKLRFAINIGSVERTGIKISAQLQKLATEIKR